MPPQARVIEWLRSSWPEHQIVETHAALVFLVGARAFKLKKAVNLGYLDFSTLERRRRTLERELTLNRRTAPDLYIGLVPVSIGAGDALSLGGDGAPVEWLLEMRRFPDDALLSKVADGGKLDADLIGRLAASVAMFHDRAELVASYDWPAAVARIATENNHDLQTLNAVLDGQVVKDTILARESARAAAVAVLCDQSEDVRHCHGDLHLGNVFLDEGEPTLFDCIEFDDFYATIVPLYDLSFLLMDLEARDLGQLANRALNSWWVHRAPDRWRAIMRSLAALPLYMSLRAEIRAKTLARVADQVARAGVYLQLAQKLLLRRPPCLVAIGGLSGTGKSSVSRSVGWRIGTRPGAIHLRTDEIRKRLRGVALEDHLQAADYTPSAATQVYKEMYELAATSLTAGQSVILDGVFAREEERDAVRAIATAAGVDFRGFWLQAPVSVLEGRIQGRHGDASDADLAVLHKQLFYDVGRVDWHPIDANGELGVIANNIMRQIVITRDA